MHILKTYLLALVMLTAIAGLSMNACKNNTDEKKPAHPEITKTPDETKPPDFAIPPAQPKVVAKVNGEEIMSDVLEQFVQRQIMMITSRGGRVQPDMVKSLRRSILETLINGILLSQEAKKQGLEVSEDEVNNYLDHIKKQAGGDDKFEVMLKQMGTSIEDLKDNIRKDMLAQKLGDQITADIKVSKKEVKKSYDEDYGLQVHASHILIKVPEGVPENEEKNALDKITEIEKRAKGGEDFAKLAEETTEDDGTRARGGDLGFFGKGQMVKPFEDAVFELKKDEITKPVRTRFGYHIIKLHERKLEKDKSFDEVKDQLEKILLNQKKQDKMGEYFTGLREKGEVQIILE